MDNITRFLVALDVMIGSAVERCSVAVAGYVVRYHRYQGGQHRSRDLGILAITDLRPLHYTARMSHIAGHAV